MTRRFSFCFAVLVCLIALLAPAAAHGAGTTGTGAVGDDQADAVWGQPDLFQNDNAGGVSYACAVTPSATTLCHPYQATLDSSGNLWVADAANNRVLMYPNSGGHIATTATKVFGQGGSFTAKDVNHGGLSAASLYGPQGVAVDGNGTLYVSDTLNQRVLVYFHAVSKPASPSADLVLGQYDFAHNAPNGNNGDDAGCPAPGPASPCTLYHPGSLSLDSNGDLLVADSNNHRVLLFPAADFVPSQPGCSPYCYIPATMVWGQFGSFMTNGQNQAHTQGTNDPCPTNAAGSPSPCTLYQPIAAVADPQGNLYIADSFNNRVLEYDEALNSGTSQYRQAATMVYGQQGSFTSNIANNGGLATGLSLPFGLALDPGGDVWVVENGNCRALEFPAAVTVNRSAATAAIAVLGQRGKLTTNSPNSGGLDGGSLEGPQAMTLDAAGNAYVSDGNNRVLEYFQPYSISARIGLAQGWNLVALPSQTGLPYSASMVISQVNQEGGKATSVAIYQNGAYKVYIPGYSADFALAPKQGFWVLASTPSVWALT